MRLEGESEGTPRNTDIKPTRGDFAMSRYLQTTCEKRDTLRGTPKSRDDFQRKRGDRADIKNPTDILNPEGEFERPRLQPYRPVDRAEIIRHPDNLKLERDFSRPRPQYIEPAE
jgi:hypothetical protein